MNLLQLSCYNTQNTYYFDLAFKIFETVVLLLAFRGKLTAILMKLENFGINLSLPALVGKAG